MSNYEFFLTSTREGGEQRDVCYDGLCRKLFCEDPEGRVIFDDEHDVQVYLFLSKMWKVPILKRWLSMVEGHVSKEEINKWNFLKVLGWMHDKCLFRKEIKKHELALFLNRQGVLKLTTKSIENGLSKEMGHAKSGILQFLLDTCLK